MTKIAHEGYSPTLFERLAAAPHPSVSFQSSFWHATAPAGPETGPLAGEVETDVAVVGGGYLGFSTALHLAEAGVEVTVLEADEPGFGASGRNTGFVVPNLLTGLDPTVMRKALGPDYGLQVCEMIGQGGELVFDLIRRHGIDCEARQSGWIQPIHTPEKRAWLEDRVAQWQKLGRPVQALSRDEAVHETGSTVYHGAFLDTSGGHLNPLAYCRGLAGAAVKAGATLFTGSRARGIERQGDRWRVSTDGGAVIARRLLLTTNATGDGLAPRAEATQFPITLFQMATQPLDPALRDSVLPNDRASADTRKELVAYRWTWDNRIVTGGLLASPFGSAERAKSYHLARLSEMLPQLPPMECAYAWQGRLAAARDFMPRLMTLGEREDDQAWSAIACNGRGMAMTTALGRRIALWLAGGSNQGLPVPITKADPVAFPGLASMAFSVWLPWNRRTDRQELKRAR
ncbi:NAD(P)/FAD-dependent oxidoreductase [Thalassobaculum litoreum]|uniref:Glycine/D-amino acid oxidase n=1 Tax=Thalassobaculum litoreum DSM 18839 TaxID=1123362 RepID=A0A8G2BME9_9PROT|nr:FAD-binding oxidoreductase [Thalassobaculum litoreum]SDG46646.1 Glycine/D-amino acid oxidase [Thalassobaculum litoreum DSM 18839]